MAHRQNYIFTNKRHSNRAIMAAILGVISNLSLVAVIYLTYAQKGEAKTGYGFTGLLGNFFHDRTDFGDRDGDAEGQV